MFAESTQIVKSYIINYSKIGIFIGLTIGVLFIMWPYIKEPIKRIFSNPIVSAGVCILSIMVMLHFIF